MKKILSLAMILLMIFPMSLTLAPDAKPSIFTPEVEQVTNNAWDDFCPVIEVDSAGDPHVAWASTEGAYYAIKSDDSWSITEIITDPPMTGGGWNWISLCLDSQEHPRIAWASPTPAPQIFYSLWDGNEWVTDQVTDWDATEGAELALALDSNDRPHIVWDSRYQGVWGVFYSERTDSGWTFEVISHHDDSHPSIALDNNDIPHVTWSRDYRVGGGGLWYASRLGATWTAERILASPAAGSTSGQHITVDSSGDPHVVAVRGAYIGPGWSSKTEILCLHKAGDTWSITQIADGINRNWWPCIALNTDNMPYVAWSSNATGVYDIYLAEYEQQWIVYNISNQPLDECRPNIAIDAQGSIHLVWHGRPGYGQGESEIYYAEIKPVEEIPQLDPWEYCPYVYLDYGCDFPWDTTPDLPVNVLYTGTYFWGDLRVIQYWFHWNVDYKWWPLGFLKSAIDYTRGEDWVSPLRQPEKQHDWEPIIVIVDDEGSIDYVLWRWHYNWLKFDLTIPGAELFHPTYEETHIKLWWAIGCHTPLTKYFAVDIPILLEIALWMRTPKQFKTALGQYGDFVKPPLYEVYEQGITYPCGMQEWDEDLALNLGFDPSDLKYVNNPTIAYSELVLPWTPILKIIVNSPVNILVTAPNGLRVGYDSVTQTIVNEIEGATYSGLGTEPQVVDIPSPLPGVYNIDIVGTDSGVYTIVIWSLTEDGLVAGIETHAGETVEGKVDCYSASISETGELEVHSWENVFEDTKKRGTMLKISTDDKHFQFIAPDKEFSIKEACKMRVRKHSIFIWHEDDEIKLVTIAIDTRIDFCFACAKDMQTRDRYLLIDKPGIE